MPINASVRGSFGSQGKFGKARIDGLTQATAAPSGVYLRNTLGITTDGVYWLNPTGSNAFQAYVINSRDGGGWVKFLQYHAGTDLSGTNALNAGGTWTTSEISLSAGKLRTADINALITGNQFLFRVTGGTDPLLNNRAGTGKFSYATTLGPWGTDVDPTLAYTLSLDNDNNGTYDESVNYTNDPQGRCTHASGVFQWYSDHNYTGAAICWGFYPSWMGTNLHWMGGGGKYSGGELYWGSASYAGSNATAASLFVR